MPPESPVIFGLHTNAEIGFLTTQSENLFFTILSLQPQAVGGGGGLTREEKVTEILDDVLEKLRENFDMLGTCSHPPVRPLVVASGALTVRCGGRDTELYGKVEERTPYVSVCLQECERMNILLNEMRRSLKELRLGIKVRLVPHARATRVPQNDSCGSLTHRSVASRVI